MSSDKGSSVVVTHHAGLKFAAQVRGHRVMVDQPLSAGGEDSAPTPPELLSASLGTCIAFYVRQFCHARHLEYEGMRVEVDPHAVQGRIERFEVRVVLPHAVPPQYAEMLQRVARSCPVHNTLAHGGAVAIGIEVPVAVG